MYRAPEERGTKEQPQNRFWNQSTRKRRKASDAPHRQRRSDRGTRQKTNDRGEPAPGGIYRQALFEPRYELSRPDSGRQYRTDESGREIRVATRVQIFDLCDVVDSASD